MSNTLAARLQQLTKLRSTIFNTTYNPESLRTGSKVLKARLKGPSLLRYYGERFSGFKGLNKAIPGLELPDLAEQQRLIDLEARRKRGKTTPKKGTYSLVILQNISKQLTDPIVDLHRPWATCLDEEEMISGKSELEGYIKYIPRTHHRNIIPDDVVLSITL